MLSVSCLWQSKLFDDADEYIRPSEGGKRASAFGEEAGDNEARGRERRVIDAFRERRSGMATVGPCHHQGVRAAIILI